MNDFISAKTPAKLNLFLKVKEKRTDGFHNLETIFEKISLFDDITISLGPSEIKIVSEGFKIPQNNTNLAYKAAKLFMDTVGIYKGVQIKIKKRILPGSGMGGGSSNAAFVLKMLNDLFKTELSNKELVCMGRKLGSDVVFFLKDYSFGLGVEKGDKIKKIETDLSFWHLIINPGVNVSTSYAYSLLDKENSNILTKNKVNVKLLIQALENNDIESVYGNLYNSFEHVVFKKFARIRKVKKKLLNLGIKGVLLTGTGSVIYCIFSNKEEVISAKEKLKSDKDFPYILKGPVKTAECI